MKSIIYCAGVILILTSNGFGQGSTDISEISLDSLLNIKINTASKYLQTTDEAPASISIVTGRDIEHYGFQTLDELLRTVRGYYISNDRNYSYLGIRGFSRPSDYNNRILIQLNGHTLNENVYGSAFIETALGLNLEEVERVEIMRGPGSAIYGTGAMFSVINIITKTGEQHDGVNASFIRGSYGKLQTNFSAGQKFNSGLDITISGTLGEVEGQDHYYEELDNPENNNGISSGMDWDRFIGLHSTLKYKDFSLQALHSYRRRGIPTGSYGALLSEINLSHDGNTFFELGYSSSIAYNKKLTVSAYYQDYSYKGIYFIDELGFDATDNKWFGGEASLQWDMVTKVRVLTGIEYKKQLVADYRMWSNDNVYFDGDFPYSSFSGYMTTQWSALSNLDLHVGFRYDHYSETGDFVVPRFAAIYSPFDGTNIKLLYGTAFRRPNIYEFYYEDIGIQKANPGLNSEHITTMEILLSQQFDKKFLGKIAFYNNYISDLIDPVIDASDSLLQFHNISKAKSLGFETELNYFPKTNLRFYISYTNHNSINEQTELKLTNSPSQIFKFGFVLPVSNLFTAGFDLYFERSRKTLGDLATTPYWLANLNLTSFRISDIAAVSFKIYNLFNTVYYSPGGYEHIQDRIKQDGRNYLLKVNFSF